MVVADGRTHAVELCWSSGRSETIRTGSDETVVDAAEAAEVAVPYGCLYGACGTCVTGGRREP